MDLKARIQNLCQLKGVSMNKLETDLGFGKGYISKLRKSTPNAAKIRAIADYFGVSVDYLLSGERKARGKKYHLNDETAAIAQDIFQNKELRILFDAARDAGPEDLTLVYNMLLALKRKENGLGA